MKNYILSAVLALVPGFAFATDCHQNVVQVQRVVAHPVTYVQPVRQVQFVEVVDNHHRQNVQKVRVVQQDNYAQKVVVVEQVKVQRVQNNHHNQQRNRGFFQRILGR